jgi:hypothetical protein
MMQENMVHIINIILDASPVISIRVFNWTRIPVVIATYKITEDHCLGQELFRAINVTEAATIIAATRAQVCTENIFRYTHSCGGAVPDRTGARRVAVVVNIEMLKSAAKSRVIVCDIPEEKHS